MIAPLDQTGVVPNAEIMVGFPILDIIVHLAYKIRHMCPTLGDPPVSNSERKWTKSHACMACRFFVVAYMEQQRYRHERRVPRLYGIALLYSPAHTYKLIDQRGEFAGTMPTRCVADECVPMLLRTFVEHQSVHP